MIDRKTSFVSSFTSAANKLQASHLSYLGCGFFTCNTSACNTRILALGDTLYPMDCNLSRGFSRPECWSGQPFASPGDLPNLGNLPQVSCLTGGFFTIWATRKVPITQDTLSQLGDCFDLQLFSLLNFYHFRHISHQKDIPQCFRMWTSKPDNLGLCPSPPIN